MRPRRFFGLAALVVLLGLVVTGLAVLTVAALPLALALTLGVLALVAGLGTQLRRRPVRRRAPASSGLPGAAPDATDSTAGVSPRMRWASEWKSAPPTEAIPASRDRVAVVLAEWGLTGAAVEPTLLVVTELLSNAIEHGRGPVSLSIELGDALVHVEVRDAAPEHPRRRPPDPRRPRGRGLQLVEGVSAQWGWTNDSAGKVVWADVPTEWPT